MNLLSKKTQKFKDEIHAHISTLVECSEDPQKYAQFKMVTKELVEHYNMNELTSIEPHVSDYICHLLVHLIDDADVLNAKFLLQRLPDEIRSQDKAIIQLATVNKHLS